MICTEAEHLQLCAANMKNKLSERRKRMKNVTLKKLTALVLSMAILLTSISLTVFSAENNGAEEFSAFIDDFESTQIGKLPEGYLANYTDGTVSVENYNNDKVLSVAKTGDGQLSIVTRSFPAMTDTGVAISFEFRQNSVKTDGTTVFALCNSVKELVKLDNHTYTVQQYPGEAVYIIPY